MIYYFDNIYFLAGLLFLFLILAGYLKIIRKKSTPYLICFLIMYIYVCELINLTQFPIYATEGMKAAMGEQNVWREMNLIPFKTIIGNLSIDLLLNIIMTLPLGFGLPFLITCSWKKVIFSGILVGALCEIGQLSSALWIGFTFRHVNIDDIILNFFGTLLGYALFKIFCHIFHWSYNKLKIPSNIFLSYILNICDENSRVSK